jgi:hypothetical protein
MPEGFSPAGTLPAGAAGSTVMRTAQTSERVGPSDGTGNFRTNCEFSHFGYDDPIVFPGQTGRSHLHAFFGNKGTNANSTATSLRSSGASTCRGGILNRSAYWVPAMYDVTTGRVVAPKSGNFYYKTGYHGVRPADVRPFPQGLRMIAGDPKNSGPGDIYGNNAWRFVCHDQAGVGVPDMASQSIPNCPAGSELWAQVFFPQCWDGANLDSPDHKSHMAYANGSNPGGPGVARGCPASHPVALPEITFNIAYAVTATSQPRNWRLVTDTYTGPAGYSMHGDWFDGWVREAVETFTARCLNTAGDCHSHLLGDGRAIY